MTVPQSRAPGRRLPLVALLEAVDQFLNEVLLTHRAGYRAELSGLGGG